MSNNRTLIKIDDKIVEIVKNKDGLTARELRDDEMFEIGVLDEGVEKLIQNDINKLTNQAYEELKQEFKSNLKANVLHIAGFRKDSFHRENWEVDHCNGRSSSVTQYLSSKVQHLMHQEMDQHVTAEEIKPLIKAAKKALLKDVDDYFRRAIRDEMYQQTQRAVKEFVAAEIKKSMVKYQKEAIEKAEVAFLGRPARLAEEE